MFTLQNIKDAYQDAYYEGTGKDAWYRDHDIDGNLNENAFVHSPMKQYIEHLTEEKELNMLVLSRRLEETLLIGKDIKVTVLGIKGNQVRLGVQAPREVSVHREEVAKRIALEEANKK